MPIRGDIAMNGLYYPDDAVADSCNQLDMMIAPLGHPKVDGHHVPAKHVLAINNNNIGAFVRKPRKKGKRVFADLCINIEAANSTEDGIGFLERLNNKEKIGVSTGLGIAQVTNESGEDDFGVAYTRIGRGYVFDHVAIMRANEVAAGEHAGTELILNESGKEEPLLIHNMEFRNELSANDVHEALNDLIRAAHGANNVFTWVREVYPDSKKFVFIVEPNNQENKFYRQGYLVDSNEEITLLDDREEVEEVREFTPVTNHQQQPPKKEGYIMNKDTLILAIIANSANGYTIADKAKLEAMDELQLIDAASVPHTEETARNALKSFEFDFDGYAVYQENKASFESFLTEQKAELDKAVEHIVTNSDFTAEQLAGKPMDELEAITGLLDKKAKRVAPGVTTINSKDTSDGDAAPACNFS